MSFFIRSKGKSRGGSDKQGLKGKGRPRQNEQEPKPKRRKRPNDDIEISSDSESEEEQDRPKKSEGYESSESDDETAAEKRLRLAKQYLAQIADEEGDDSSGEEDAVGKRLQKDFLEEKGRLQKNISELMGVPSVEDIMLCRGHKLPVTCVVVSNDCKHAYSASKDCSIIKWNLEIGKKVSIIHGGRKGTEETHLGHTAHVLCLAISTDSKYLVSGDRNKLMKVWNPSTMELLHTFTGHRDAVTGLAFRKNSHQLFSASSDRTVKVWSLDEMAYVETLFGHQDTVTAIDSLNRERAITCGGRDCSVRIWKILEESQLVFHGHSGSIDCVSLINEENFISGADDNSLSLWSVMKKKPLTTVRNAHKGDESCESAAAHENWISSVVSLQHTDVIASGSKDGSIKVWKCGKDFKSMNPLFTVPVPGFVNSLKFTPDGSYLVAAVGQEHRLGRWWRIKEAKNAVYIIKIPRKIPVSNEPVEDEAEEKTRN